jgi:hypothetical protein
MDGRSDPSHYPFGCCAVMSGVDLDAERYTLTTGIERGSDGTHSLGEHARRATMQDPVRLRIALDRHGGNYAIRGGLDNPDAHSFRQRATVRFVRLAVCAVAHARSFTETVASAA